jgi:hypothetical protein
MYSKRTLYRRNLIGALIMLSFMVAFAMTNASAIFAQSAPQAHANLKYSQVKQEITIRTSKDYELLAVPPGCNPTGGSGGLAVGTHKTTVAGLNAIVVVGQGYNPQTPTVLGFLIHGDGGVYDAIQSSSSPLNKVANEHGWIVVSPQSPNGQTWWNNWNGDHNKKFADVLDAMFAKYNLCRKIIFGLTGSGGSEFWTAYFFPEKGGKYPAHTLVACGGNDGHDSTSRNQIIALGDRPGIVGRSSFYYVYGSQDSLVPPIEESINFYRDAGFNVSVEKIEGAGHCNQWSAQGLTGWHERGATYWENKAAELGVN